MNPQVIKDSIRMSITGEKKFPEIVGLLLKEGVESYHVDLVRSENRYYKADGTSLVEPVAVSHPKAALAFSEEGVRAAVRKSQQGQISYPEFLKEISEAGCVSYIAFLAGKRVTYFGREGASTTEYFPGAGPKES